MVASREDPGSVTKKVTLNTGHIQLCVVAAPLCEISSGRIRKKTDNVLVSEVLDDVLLLSPPFPFPLSCRTMRVGSGTATAATSAVRLESNTTSETKTLMSHTVQSRDTERKEGKEKVGRIPASGDYIKKRNHHLGNCEI